MIVLEVQQADVTRLDVDAITNAANTQLKHGGGVVFAVHADEAERAFRAAVES